MKKLESQEKDIGQNQDSKKKQSLAVSQPKKIGLENGKDSTAVSQSTNGSPILETQREKTSESLENEADNGSSTTQKKKTKSLMPVPKLSALESRTLQALKRLRVKPELLQTIPPITKMLKRDLKGGLKTALEAMRFSTNDEVVTDFLKTYDKIPVGDRDRIPWEAIIIKSKVNPTYLLGAIRLAVETYSWNRSRFVAVSNHPNITKARVKFALSAQGGFKDRDALDIQVGAMQGPKGPTFIGKQVAVFGGNGGGQNNSGGGNVMDAEVDSDDGFENLFPSPNEIQDKLVPIRQRLLEG